MTKLDALKEAVLTDTPYFGTLLSVITIMERKESELQFLAGIGVHKKFGNLLMYLREDLYNMPMPQQVAVVIHELYHVVFSHVTMGGAVDKKDMTMLNAAMDLVINQEISNLPENCLTVEKFGLPPNLTTWEYYDLLKKQQQENQATQPMQGHDSHDGFGEDKALTEACKDAVLQADAASKGIISRKCSREAFNQQKSLLINQGSRDVTRQILRQVCKLAIQSKDQEKTYAKASRRYDDFPGNIVQERPRIFVGIDTSGSISEELISDAMGVVIQLAKSIGADVECGLWHTTCYEVFKVTKNTIDTKQVEQGGTDIQDFFNVAEKKKADLTVVISDGQFSMPPYPKGTKIVWVLSSECPGWNEPRTIKAYV